MSLVTAKRAPSNVSEESAEWLLVSPTVIDVVTICLLCFGSACIFARLYTRHCILRQLGWDDLALVIGFVSQLCI